MGSLAMGVGCQLDAKFPDGAAGVQRKWLAGLEDPARLFKFIYLLVSQVGLHHEVPVKIP